MFQKQPVSMSSPDTQATHGRKAKPFLKWAGGKQQLLSQFEAFFPKAFSRYIEPFTGGGAVFFHLWNVQRLPSQVCLIDHNEELINAYQVVRQDVDALIHLLHRHKQNHCQEYYYHVRKMDRGVSRSMSEAERAARTVYLNRTCYNGLYRVNRRGEFNVPMGSYANPRILYEDVLRAASIALQGVSLSVNDFRSIVEMALPGDFYYFDPPYDPLSKTANFTGYTANSFGDQDQRDLADVFQQLSDKGCFCMLSNAHTPFVLDLYRDFRIAKVSAKRAVNSNGNSRGAVLEVVVMNYGG